MKFSIPIHGYGDPKYPHAACFVDFVRALAAALRDLGHELVPPTTNGSDVDKTARPIAFGEQNLISLDVASDPGSFCPPNAILYNSEQTGARGASARLIFDAVKTWKNRVVWDYSEVNMKALRKLGLERLVHCPVAYHPVMTRIQPLPPEQEDIDVLFYGSIEPPMRIIELQRTGVKLLDRAKILHDCKRAGLNVQHVFNVYAQDLDPYIARAKVVINLHYYEGAIFEIFRCSQLLANKKCIVTEGGGVDDQLEDFAKRSMLYVQRKDIVEACKAMVENYSSRRIQGDRGFHEFAKSSLTANVRQALLKS